MGRRKIGRRIMHYICEYDRQGKNLTNKKKILLKIITKTETKRDTFVSVLKSYFYRQVLTVHKFSDTSPFRMWGLVPPRPECSEKQYLVDPCFSYIQ